MRIYTQTNGKMTEAERLQLATLLVKAGYQVKIVKGSINNKPAQIVEAEAT
ncbi:MAG: hypothetical protein PHP22_03525 [Oscillospiraceae bacterium]|nr:hypothetical protein [Oscillospiraceae bacterium]